MKIRCPRCGKPGYLYQDTRELKSGVQTYFFVYHKVKEGKKWVTRKCAVGSQHYIYVSKTHTLPVAGVKLSFSNVLEPEKLLYLSYKSIRNVIKFLQNLDDESRKKEVKKLLPRVEKILKILDKLTTLIYQNSR
ncbi:MAG: hypothetical protein QW607_09955 [Desulfurococcaceae archaeon]